MDTSEAAYEIGKIEAKFEAGKVPPVKKTTLAPEPIKPLNPRGSATPKSMSEIADDKEWFDRRREQKKDKLLGKH
jgi:hypothetical protein